LENEVAGVQSFSYSTRAAGNHRQGSLGTPAASLVNLRM
jgi:hypothetical protein